MSRRVQQPIPVKMRTDGTPNAFTRRGVRHPVRIIGHWRLATRWWDAGRDVDRTYYRVETADHQLFELYCDVAHRHGWVLDVIQDRLSGLTSPKLARIYRRACTYYCMVAVCVGGRFRLRRLQHGERRIQQAR